ncbi:MAG: LacI family transcriptional regulator [Planctomycetes bacterium]|nr:LacI family transcriptional regulator [Planctomycetota bacterium]
MARRDPAAVTIATVAARAGVSKAAVSKALSVRAGVCDLAPGTRERIVAVARELGYSPDRRRQGRARTHVIALVFGAATPRFSGLDNGLVEAVTAALAGRGYRLSWMPLPGGIRAWEQAAPSLQADGLVFTDPPPAHLDRILADNRLPAVVLNLNARLPAARFRPDDRQGARLLVEHLAARGLRRIAYLRTRHRSGHPSLADRLEGYREAMAARGLPTEEHEGPPELLADHLLSGGGRAGAVVYNASDAVWLHAELVRRGVQLPARIALACCDQSDEVTLRGITALRLPFAELGTAAVSHLLAQLEAGDGDAGDHVQPVRLVVRAST